MVFPHVGVDTSILGNPPLGDAHPRLDLQPGQNRSLEALGEIGLLDANAINSEIGAETASQEAPDECPRRAF